MSDTSPSLLERLRARPEASSWQRFVDLYTPLIHGWLRRHGLQAQDVDDLCQEVLGVLVRELPQFFYDRRRGSFRAWLKQITVNRLHAFWRARRSRPSPCGGSDFLQTLNELEDPRSDLSLAWDRDHDRHVARRLLQMIAPEFEPTTWRAFQRLALDGVKAADVAAELGVSVNAVFIAKSRVSRRLRQEMRGLTD